MKPLNFADAFKTLWPVFLIVMSLVAQWTLLGQRVETLEERVDRQGTSLTELRSQVTESQKDVAALTEKVDGIKESVEYIRNRIDRALTNN